METLVTLEAASGWENGQHSSLQHLSPAPAVTLSVIKQNKLLEGMEKRRVGKHAFQETERQSDLYHS